PLLHPRDGLPRSPPAPRDLERLPDPGRLASRVHRHGEDGGLDHRGADRDRQRVLSRGRPDRIPEMKLESKVPDGPIEKKWDKALSKNNRATAANKRKFTVIMVGSGLAGAGGAAAMAELGYRVKCFCYQDSPRRAHSIAAQGGINAAKNYRNDG